MIDQGKLRALELAVQLAGHNGTATGRKAEAAELADIFYEFIQAEPLSQRDEMHWHNFAGIPHFGPPNYAPPDNNR